MQNLNATNDNQNLNIDGKRICCVGMCVLDIIHVCANYPVEDTDKRCLSGYMQRGGNASNMCTILRELGYDAVEFLGMMSKANGFEFLQSDCKRRKIIYENCPSVTQDPPFSSVILVQNTDSRTIIHSNSNFPILKYQHFKENLKNQLNKYSWIHFEARNPTETLQMQRDIQAFNLQQLQEQQQQQQQHKQNIIISVEFEKVFEENLILALAADYIFLGKDLSRHMGWNEPETAVYKLREWIENVQKEQQQQQQQQQILKVLEIKKPIIICPWGALGAGLLDSDNNYSFSPAQPPLKIVDALGAGDTFCAATIFSLLPFINQGLTPNSEQLKKAVDFGNFCAGLKLGQYGYDGLKENVTKSV